MIKLILEINGKQVLILPENPHVCAVCDVDGETPLTTSEKKQLIEWIDKYLV